MLGCSRQLSRRNSNRLCGLFHADGLWDLRRGCSLCRSHPAFCAAPCVSSRAQISIPRSERGRPTSPCAIVKVNKIPRFVSFVPRIYIHVQPQRTIPTIALVKFNNPVLSSLRKTATVLPLNHPPSPRPPPSPPPIPQHFPPPPKPSYRLPISIPPLSKINPLRCPLSSNK
jgi:hypothetical protein